MEDLFEFLVLLLLVGVAHGGVVSSLPLHKGCNVCLQLRLVEDEEGGGALRQIVKGRGEHRRQPMHGERQHPGGSHGAPGDMTICRSTRGG